MKFLWSSICIQTRANKHDSKTPYTAVVANFYTNEVFKWRNFTYHTLISVCIHHILSVDTTFSRLSLQNTPWSWNSDKFVRVWNETNECLAAKLSNVERSLGQRPAADTTFVYRKLSASSTVSVANGIRNDAQFESCRVRNSGRTPFWHDWQIYW